MGRVVHGAAMMNCRETRQLFGKPPAYQRQESRAWLRTWPMLLALLQVALKVEAGQAADPPAAKDAPRSAEEPIFRLEAGGPSSLVTGLSFAPDGRTLYVAGWDKIVRVWGLDKATGMF